MSSHPFIDHAPGFVVGFVLGTAVIGLSMQCAHRLEPAAPIRTGRTIAHRALATSPHDEQTRFSPRIKRCPRLPRETITIDQCVEMVDAMMYCDAIERGEGDGG